MALAKHMIMKRQSSSKRGRAALCFILLLVLPQQVPAWTSDCLPHRSRGGARSTAMHAISPAEGRDFTSPKQSTITRRGGIQQILSLPLAAPLISAPPAAAYTPDADPLRESLYLMSRVQEATVQQERFVNRASQQDALKSKMKLTLRLVEKNYRLLDQITFASEYVTPASKVVDATTAGYEAAEALQNAIDYVNSDLKSGPFKEGQKEYLTSNLSECRERMFDFLGYMPQDKLAAARKRVEEENVANRDEFDGDSDAGVYNPVILPWKNR